VTPGDRAFWNNDPYHKGGSVVTVRQILGDERYTVETVDDLRTADVDGDDLHYLGNRPMAVGDHLIMAADYAEAVEEDYANPQRLLNLANAYIDLNHALVRALRKGPRGDKHAEQYLKRITHLLRMMGESMAQCVLAENPGAM